MTMKEQEQEQHIAGGALVEVEGEELRELGYMFKLLQKHSAGGGGMYEVGIGNCSEIVGHVRGFQRRLQQSTRHVQA